MTPLQLWELIFSLLSGVGGIGTVVVEIMKDKKTKTDENKTKEES